MGFTTAIEQRLDNIQENIAHGYCPEEGMVYLSAADAHWLVLLARNTLKRGPSLSFKQLKAARIVFYVFLTALAIVSLTGIVWGISSIIKLF